MSQDVAGFNEQRGVGVREPGHVESQVSFAVVASFGVELRRVGRAGNGGGDVGVGNHATGRVRDAEMQGGAPPRQPGFGVNQFQRQSYRALHRHFVFGDVGVR